MTYNLENVKSLITGLIELETNLEDKLDLLTSIGITARNEITFRACEDIRNEIPCDSDSEVRKGDSLESGHRRSKVRNVLREKPSDAVLGERSTRQKLDAILPALNAVKQKTFVFEGITFSLPLVKKFMSECKTLPDLTVTVCENAMLLKWANGNAKINSFEFAEKLKADAVKVRELLK